MKLLLPFLFVLPLAIAAEPDLHEQLRDALYTEEVTRDPAAAADTYRKILANFDKQRPLAASALFRLAEIRRKQERKDEAIALYQRLLNEFPDFERESELSRQHLETLGAAPTEKTPPANDPDLIELRRLKELARTSPDLILDPKTLNHTVDQGLLHSIRFLLEETKNPGDDDTLALAVETGNLTTCVLLLQHMNPTPTQAGRALRAAIGFQHFVILELLLDSGLDPSTPIDATNGLISRPLIAAVEKADENAVNLLLKMDADIDFMIESRGYPYTSEPIGTALHSAVHRGHLNLVRLLLEKGAKPDLPTPNAGLTPLHLATASPSPQASGLLKLLLENKADPNRKTILVSDPGNSSTQLLYANKRPLDLALENGNRDSVKLLIKSGAKLESNTPYVQTSLSKALRDKDLNTLKLLLESGLDPNTLDSGNLPPLAHALNAYKQAILELLLKHGADPNLPFGQLTLDLDGGNDPFGTPDQDPFSDHQGTTIKTTNSLLHLASESPDTFAAFMRLLAAGAKPGPGLGFIMGNVAKWDEHGNAVRSLLEFRPEHFDPNHIPDMSRWKPAARKVFLETAVYPALSSPTSVRFLFLHSGKWKTMVQKIESPSMPSLVSLFKNQQNFILKPMIYQGSVDIYRLDLHLLRKSDNGRWAATPIHLENNDPLPEPKWGDIITAQPDTTSKSSPAAQTQIAATFEWSLHKRLSFPVTVEVDGQKRDLTLKGNLLAVNPVSNDWPILSAGDLASYLWPEFYPYSKHPKLTVEREGWGVIPLDPGDNGTRDFQLQADDIVRIVAPEGVQNRRDSQRSCYVLVTIPGTPFTQCFGDITSESGSQSSHPATIPTLSEAIAATFAPTLKNSKTYTNDGAKYISTDASTHRIRLPELPPHPDFSRILIRRLLPDGAEKLIKVDLTEIISSCADGSAEKARSADTTLQPGDIVELPLPDGETSAWQGFTTREKSFLKLIHSGSIRAFASGRPPEKYDMHWSPADWIDTGSGTLPFIPSTGITHSSSDELARYAPWPNATTITVERGGKQLPAINSKHLILHNGDNVFFKSSPSSRVRRVRTVPSR